MLEFLRHLDRRWIFLAIMLAVGIPIVSGQTFPEQPTVYVKSIFDYVEELPEGSNVLIAIDYDPATAGELTPMTHAFIRHCCLRRHKMFFLTLWETAPPLLAQLIEETVEQEFAASNFKYGEDYVNLGYSAGREVVIAACGINLHKSFPRDAKGNGLDQMPITANITNLKDFDLIFNLSAGYPGWKEWVQYAGSPHKIPLAAGVTAVGAPQAYPYLPNQMFGLMAAIKGAAEYEAALGERYEQYRNNPDTNDGIRRMAPQLWAHLLIIGLIVLGNVLYFTERRAGRVL
jgi:hypothetical protein